MGLGAGCSNKSMLMFCFFGGFWGIPRILKNLICFRALGRSFNSACEFEVAFSINGHPIVLMMLAHEVSLEPIMKYF